MLRLIVMPAAFLLLFWGCSTEEVKPIKTSSSDASTSGSGSGGSAGTANGSSTNNNSGGSGNSGSASGTGDGVDGGSWGNDTEICGLAEPNLQGKAVGVACTTHEECSTGYCYEEALWNEKSATAGTAKPNRFCTVACSNCGKGKECRDWPSIVSEGSQSPGNKCFPLLQYYIDHFKLKYDSVCLVGCWTDADCAGLEPYTNCRGLTFGKDSNYGSPKVCQPDTIELLGEDKF